MVFPFNTNGFSDPSSWNYSLNLRSNGSRWTTKHLPYPVFAENLELKFTDEFITTESTKLWMLEQPIKIGGDLTHRNLSDWKGWLKFNGTVRENFANWLKEKNLFPEKYFPKLPCTLKDLKIKPGLHAIQVNYVLRYLYFNEGIINARLLRGNGLCF